MTITTITRGPLLYHVGNDQAVIWWQTNQLGSGNGITWTTGGAGSDGSATAVSNSFVGADGSVWYVHYARMHGLTPASLYNVTIVGEELISAPRAFVTFPSDGTLVKLGVFGSSEGNVGAALPGLAHTIAQLTALGVQGYLGTGGYTRDGVFADRWRDEWLVSAMTTALATKPFLGCRGASDGSTDTAKAFLPFGGSDRNGLAANDVFEVSIGKARIIGLDTSNLIRRLGLRTGGAQANWLLNEATQRSEWKNALYRVILVHHPSRVTYWDASGSYGDSPESATGTDSFLHQHLNPLLKKSGADLVLFGVGKSYQRGALSSDYPDNPFPVHHVMVAGGGGYKHTTKAWSFPPPEEPGIVAEATGYVVGTLSITTSFMVFEAYDLATSTVIDQIQVVPHTLL